MKTYIIEGTFVGEIEAEDENDAVASFTELHIDSYSISSVAEEEE